MIRLVSFDLDGTLADTVPGILHAANLTRADYGLLPIDRERLVACINHGARALVRGFLSPEYDGGDDDYESAFKLYGEHYRETCRETKVCYPGVRHAIGKLLTSDVSVAVLTNKGEEATKIVLGNLFPVSPFFRVCANVDGKPPKPDPAALFDMMRALGLTEDEVVHIGDSDVDIETARRAGVRSIGVSWGYRPEEDLIRAGATAIVHDARAIPDVIGRMQGA